MSIKYLFAISATVLATTLPIVFTTPASAAAKVNTNANKTPKDVVGYDVSWPQCSSKLPSDPAFVVVGVNGGRADEANPCLQKQLDWAKAAPGTPDQPGLQLYLNTANPGVSSESWPTNNLDPLSKDVENPYMICDGSDSQACAWQYGYNKAFISDKSFFASAAGLAGIAPEADKYIWWLDVEYDNSWQLGSEDAQSRNRAVLEGMADYLIRQDVKTVGIYSTIAQWTDITGGKNKISASSSLNAMPDWRPSGTLPIAKYNCSKAQPLTNDGRVALTQYVVGGLDRNYSCPR
ncbi:hypothetical protein EOL73_01975 [Candidatus Saccharibacteria bacterium]|nr:hypothetical protein [Candidatus Saccharibacteria bacterium]NCU40504.1 hypothetical protein [Candidatus Saccharibacteria bacterium]